MERSSIDITRSPMPTFIWGECGKIINLNMDCAGGKIEKNELGGACGAYGGGERCEQGSGGET